MSHNNFTAGPQSILAAAQNLTDAWVDLGGEIDTRGAQSIAAWLNLDINDTNNPRVRLLAKHTSAGTDEYSPPIKTTSASAIAIEAEYMEWNADSDQKTVITWTLDRVVPYVQLQVQAGTVGATAGQIDSAYITLGY